MEKIFLSHPFHLVGTHGTQGRDMAPDITPGGEDFIARQHHGLGEKGVLTDQKGCLHLVPGFLDLLPFGRPPYREPLDEEGAKDLIQYYLEASRNPNLKLGDVKDKRRTFEAEIVTKDGSLVDKIVIDKRSGWMRSVYLLPVP